MEKTDQAEVEYLNMMEQRHYSEPQELWFDIRLSEKEMDFLRDACSVKAKVNWNHDLAGNISKSELITDKGNWFYESALKKPTEKMFYDDWNNYRKYHIGGDESPPKFIMNGFWVNYMKQHEFNPLHCHGGLFSFVIFVKIPTYWKEQHALSFSANSNMPLASDFVFVWPERSRNICMVSPFQLSPEDEGRMLFFPAYLQHMVYPFYGTEEERGTISGNIVLEDTKNEIKVLPSGAVVNAQPDSIDEIIERKNNSIKAMENSIKITKKELERMKKERENEE